MNLSSWTERRDQSDSAKSLAHSVSGALESLWERRLAATTIALGATSRSDHVRSLAFFVAGSDVTQRPREVARVYCDTERPIRATTPGRSQAGPGLERGSEVPQRRHKVAPAGRDVIRATGPSRSHIRCPELESRSGSDVSQRPREVARVSVAGSDVIRATRLSRSHFLSPRLENRSRNDVWQRPREVARVFCRWDRRDAATM
ncbi:hypothetical protein F2Q69_00024003 [Brassica cretica]|uniref:Uncharacterized protein n=1 Tax=Brassica cretica TaxID=69181 RepID=A0A8S9QA28_BRACR|nr:hypothetical protein F2Q69_00024003 [Brassica cretica]